MVKILKVNDNLTGINFGFLIAIKQNGEKQYRHYVSPLWLCKCKLCNKEINVSAQRLISGKSKSCGCLMHTRLYSIYHGMKCRVYGTHKYHEYYKDINICQEWLNDFMNFYNWSIDNGYQDNLSIDRIDGNKDYCPENCRWATNKEQQNNTSYNIYGEIDGEKFTPQQISKKYNISIYTIYSRIERGLKNCELISSIEPNKTGVVGVSYNEKYNKWNAYLTYNGKHYFKWCDNKEEAVKYRKQFESDRDGFKNGVDIV